VIQKSIIAAAAIGTAAMAITTTAQAFNFGNMMNPSRWFNDDDDYYRRGYGYGPYGGYGYGPYGGYGYGPYGGGWGGPWGGPYGGYGRPSTIVVNPSDSSRQPAPRTPE
jgi:hypothetical protein